MVLRSETRAPAVGVAVHAIAPYPKYFLAQLYVCVASLKPEMVVDSSSMKSKNEVRTL